MIGKQRSGRLSAISVSYPPMKKHSKKYSRHSRGSPHRWALFLFLIGSIVVPNLLAAYPFDEDTLVLELWTELEPVVSLPEEKSGPLSRREAVERVLEEARIVISAMLYGFDVEYTPPDSARQVEERFQVEPVARISKGDSRLQTLDTRTSEGRFYVRFRYNMAEHQIRRRSSWQSNTIPSVTAEGTIPLYKGYTGKFESFEEAIKQGLRAYFRPREYNKPREILATVLFREPPRTRITAGGYHSKVDMKLRIKEVVPYGAY